MKNEAQSYNAVKKYLENLGYPTSTIIPEYTSRESQVDMVVVTEGNVLIVVEIKSNFFKEGLAKEEFGYNPVTRRLQKVATELNAKYFIVSDGSKHVWLKTGVNGRPETTIEIAYSNFNAKTISDSEYTKTILKHIAEYLRNFSFTEDYVYVLSIVLYLKLREEIQPQENAIASYKDIISTDDIPGNFAINEGVLLSALDRLSDLKLLDNRNTVLEFIDEFFTTLRRELTIPRWLADLMTRLIDLDPESLIVDMFAWNGVLTASAYLNGYRNVLSFYKTKTGLFWLKIHQLLVIQKEPEIIHEHGFTSGNFSLLKPEFADAVLLAPPFNMKLTGSLQSKFSKNGLSDGNAIFLEAALNSVKKNGKVIAILPDGFLSSNQSRAAREYFSEYVEAIISLPSDTFKPLALVKTSLIILNKKRKNIHGSMFMASLDKIPIESALYQERNKEVEAICSNYNSFKLGDDIQTSHLGLVVDDFKADSFTFSKYWFDTKSNQQDYLESGFLSVPLKQVCNKILRGSNLIKHEGGEIPYLSPACIRELRIVSDEMSYTSQDKIPHGKVITADVDDVLVNIIGSYRGTAALVTKDFAGLPINRHLALLTPDKNLICPGYLAIALNSAFVQEQFYDRATGSVIQALNLASFDNIIIQLPSIEKQERILEEYNLILDKLALVNQQKNLLESDLSIMLNKLGKGGGQS